MFVESGYSLRLRMDTQLNVLIDTMIITATRAAAFTRVSRRGLRLS